MFPNDTQTVYHELVGVSNYTLLPTGTYTILGVSIQQSGVASDSFLRCGTNVIAKNYAKDFPYSSTHYICVNNSINIDKTGQDNASFIVNYVPYDLSLTSTTTATTTSIINGFTYGEVMIILLLLMIFTIKFFSELKQWIFGVRLENPVKNKYNKDFI